MLIDGNAYLFDPFLGMPIPGKDGIRHDAQGRLELQPATLAEILADPALLKRLDIDSQKTYPVKQADLRNRGCAGGSLARFFVLSNETDRVCAWPASKKWR